MATPIEARLGPIERIHRIRPGLRRMQFLTALACLIGAVAAWAAAAVGAFIAYTEYGPLLVGRWAAPPAIIGVALLALGLILGWRAWRTARLRIRLHAHGIAVVRGRRGRALPWEEVLTVWSRVERIGMPWASGPSRQRLEIEASDGRRVRLTEQLENFKILSQAVKSRVYPALLAAYTESFNQGRPIAFGPLILHKQGLRNGRRGPFGWSDVNSATLAAGRLTIELAGPGRGSRWKVPAHRIPNVELCAQLIQEIQQTV